MQLGSCDVRTTSGCIRLCIENIGEENMPKNRKAGSPHDETIGANVRRLRLFRGLSQEKLGDALDLTFQQVQKYEKGTNRISGTRLIQISRVLKVPLLSFFEGINLETGATIETPFNQFAIIAGVARFVETVNDLPDPVDKVQVIKACQAVANVAVGGT